MDAALIAGYQQPGAIKCTLIRFDLPGGPLCLTDGGFTSFDAGEGEGAETYFSRHPTYGVMSSVGSIKDGEDAGTTRIDVVLQPASDVAAAALGSPSIQGCRVQWWEGVINRSTGGLVGIPELKFDGEIDKPRLSVDEDSLELTLECGTQAERQLEPNADWRLNNAFHTLVWPGEMGMAFVDGVTRKKEWRSRPENPGVFKRLLKAFVPIANL